MAPGPAGVCVAHTLPKDVLFVVGLVGPLLFMFCYVVVSMDAAG